MAYLNADCPPIECFVRSKFLYDGAGPEEICEPALIHGVHAVAGQALMFAALLPNGANFWRLPIHAFTHRRDAPVRELYHLELWDCPSHHLSVHEFGFLAGQRARCALTDVGPREGHYLFTVDFCGAPSAESFGATGHKCMHIIQLDEGSFAALPNNRVQILEPSWVTDPFREPPPYRIQSRIWQAEPGRRLENSDAYFYRVGGSARPDPVND